MLVEALVVRPPCLQRAAGHMQSLGCLTQGKSLGLQIVILVKECGASGAIPAWVMIIVASLLVLDIIVNKPIDQKVVELSSSQRYSLVENSMYHAVFLLKAYKMTFSYNQVKERPKLFLAMTGLTHAEFEQLLPHFQGALDQYVQDNYIDRDKRQRQYGGGKPESTLITIEDKLLFILYYVKVYPLQEILAFEFDMVQSTANEWIHILRGV